MRQVVATQFGDPEVLVTNTAPDPVARPGQVVVLAAGGGLGILLVQLVHAASGRVIAAARGRRKLDLVRRLGAAVVVDYSEPDWATRVLDATGGTGPDVVFDSAGGEIGRAAF